MTANEQTRRVEAPHVQPPRMTPRPGVAPKPMAKKNSNDGVWMAGLAALMGVGLGVAGTAIAGNSDEDPVGTANQVRDAEDQIDQALEESQAAQDKMAADDAKPVVEEEVVVEHHHHYHDRPVPPPTGFTDEEIQQGGTTNNGGGGTSDDAEIEVMGYAREMGDDGQMYDVAYIKVGDNMGIVMDSNLDGIADNLIMDFNGDGDISKEEVINLKEAGVADVDMRPFAQEVNFNYDNMEPSKAYAAAYMPDGTEGTEGTEGFEGMEGTEGTDGGDFLISNDEGDGPDYTQGEQFVSNNEGDDIIIGGDETEIYDDVQYVSNDDDVIISDDVVELGGTDDDVMYASLVEDDAPLTDEELLSTDDELMVDSEELSVDADYSSTEDYSTTTMDDGSDLTGGDETIDTSYV